MGRGIERKETSPPHQGQSKAPQMSKLFQKLADGLSFILTTWHNFVIWVILVVVWIAAGPWIASHNFLPDWFTSNAFNFPLNTVTTLAELYIGFLLGVNAARIQRAQDEHTEYMQKEIDHMKAELDKLCDHLLPKVEENKRN
jgi:hypothetical protein